MTFVFLYALSVYFCFHVVSQADILNRPRNWAVKTFPWWMTYWMQCPFCMCFWVSLLVYIIGWIPLYVVTVAPVIALILNLVIQRLRGAPSTDGS